MFAAYRGGIVTSASLMVRWPAALDAAAFARDAPELSFGLHLDLAEWAYAGGEWETIYERVDHTDADAVRSEVWRQIERFDQLYGHYPNHLDSHQHVHRSEPVRSTVLEVSAELGIVVREEDPGISDLGAFHGQTAVASRSTMRSARKPSDPPSLPSARVRPSWPATRDWATKVDRSTPENGTSRSQPFVTLSVRAVIDASDIRLCSFGDVGTDREGATE